MGFCGCFDGGKKMKERKRSASYKLPPDEAPEVPDTLAPVETTDARIKAAEAAQKRQDEFKNSAVGKAALAVQKAATANTHRGEPALKWQMG
ncbi:unnamed protein product [Cuscuta epithymum]|uniref:Small VCP/p97-interacting protein n=1 Tax=Cuscuta epithymum TaxID=186058 RepID=A0AAV0GAH6_9ASTE|nr:unnamed protein product [Cuscuta epithymum]